MWSSYLVESFEELFHVVKIDFRVVEVQSAPEDSDFHMADTPG
jgi:hypothetical protein